MNISDRNKKILQIKNILLDISQMYDSNGLNIAFTIYKKCDDVNKVKVEVTETF
jgi:hypothetical protein